MAHSDDRLLTARLRSYVRTLRGADIGDDDETSSAGHIVDGRATYLTDNERGLGPALWWAAAKGFTSLDVVVETGSTPNQASSPSMPVSEVSGHLCRRASLFNADISVWQADGPDLSPAAASSAIVPPELPSTHWAFAGVISDAGARPVDDHGRLIGEVAGLEIARVVTGDDESVKLEVGVGQADRELQQYIHGHATDDENLRRCVVSVMSDRRVGSGSHPLTRVVRQRWLRSILLDNPSLVGLSELEAVVPLRPSATVLRLDPAAAYSPKDNVIVITSAGVDPDLLPEAVDYRQRVEPSSKLVIALPERDKELATGRLINMVSNVDVVSIEEPWSSH